MQIIQNVNALDVIRDVPDDVFLISDPPYNVGYHYRTYTDNLPAREYANMLSEIFIGHRSVVMHYPEQLINVVAPALGEVQEVMAWVYNTNQGKQHRLVGWWDCKPDWSRTPQEYKNPTDKRVKLLIEQGKRARGYDWFFSEHVKNVSKDHEHPCPISFEVAERMVLATTEPGDTVCDPFAGSGTIVAAALHHGRRAFGFEIDEEYARLAAARISEQRQTAMFV